MSKLGVRLADHFSKATKDPQNLAAQGGNASKRPKHDTNATTDRCDVSPLLERNAERVNLDKALGLEFGAVAG